MLLTNGYFQILVWILSLYYYGGTAETRVRVVLDKNEALIIPSDAQVKIIRPIINNKENSFKLSAKQTRKKPQKKPIYTINHLPSEKPTQLKSKPKALKSSPIIKPFYTGPQVFKDPFKHHWPDSDFESDLKLKTFKFKSSTTVSPLIPTTKFSFIDNFKSNENVDDDIRPVTELIEDDLKYDFRTKTHSIR